MRVLLDTCVWGGARAVLGDQGHDVEWAGDWAEDPGDDEILRRAHQAARVLVTLDKDSGELAIVRGMPHAGIVRLVDSAARAQLPARAIALAKYTGELQAGAVITVQPGRVRVRPAAE